MPAPDFQRPYVVSWNLTYRCNLACEHCYLDAGGKPQVTTENFSDRSELGTVLDELGQPAVQFDRGRCGHTRGINGLLYGRDVNFNAIPD